MRDGGVFLAVMLFMGGVHCASAREPAEVLDSKEGIYVTVHGQRSFVLRDNAGRARPSDPRTPQELDFPGAVIDRTGERGYSFALTPEYAPYRLEFASEGGSIQIEFLIGRSNTNARVAKRYLDINLPSSTRVQFMIPGDDTARLAYDADGDGTYETAIKPTADVKGADARDSLPPTLGFSGWPVITIEAKDDLSGVKRILISTDLVHFYPYEAPFTVPASQQRILALVEDKAGNRSGILEYRKPGSR